MSRVSIRLTITIVMVLGFVNLALFRPVLAQEIDDSTSWLAQLFPEVRTGTASTPSAQPASPTLGFANLIDDDSLTTKTTFGMLLQPKGQLETWFEYYGKAYGVSGDKLSRIAWCESTHNLQATNGVYGGLFQFNPLTWSAQRKRMGLDPNPDLRFDAQEAIKTAAHKIGSEGTWAWPVCGER